MEDRRQIKTRPQVQNPITGIPPNTPAQKKEKKVSTTQQTVQKMTATIKHLKQKAREIEELSHKKESQLLDDANFLKLEKRLEKHSMISSMYIGNNTQLQ